eukprot:PITA_33944
MNESIVLGHHASATGIKVDPVKIEVIAKLAPPTNQREPEVSLDMLATIEVSAAFDTLKEKPSSALALRGPDWKLPSHISTNASDSTIGVALGEKEDIVNHAIYYVSKKLTTAELNYKEFNITLLDRPGKENQVVDFLSRLNHAGEDVPLNDSFPDEHLFSISIKTIWFLDMANYIATGKLPPYFSSN